MLIFNIIIRYRNFVWSKIKKIKKKLIMYPIFGIHLKKCQTLKRNHKTILRFQKDTLLFQLKTSCTKIMCNIKNLTRKGKIEIRVRHYKSDIGKLIQLSKGKPFHNFFSENKLNLFNI